MKEKQEENIKAKCVEVFKQTFTRNLRTRILNSCSVFRARWDMTLHPLEEWVVANPNTYDLLNNVEVGKYDEHYYIEKEGLCINYVSKNEEDDFVNEELKYVAPQVETNKDLPSSSNAPATSSGTFDGLVHISFSQPLPGPRVTFKWLVGLSTPECRIDPIDQSLTSITTDFLTTPSTSQAANPLTSKDDCPLGQRR